MLMESSNIEGKVINFFEEQQQTLQPSDYCRAYQHDELPGTFYTFGSEGKDLNSSGVFSVGDFTDQGDTESYNIMLTGVSTNKAIENVLKLGKKSVQIFQVPHNGSAECLHWFYPDENTLIKQCIKYYSFFQANVYLISTGKNPLDHPSAEVLSGIIIANAMREPVHKCVIVLSNSRGLCRRKLNLLEEKYEAAKQQCLELKKKGETYDLFHVRNNLESLIQVTAKVEDVESFNDGEKKIQKAMKELISNTREFLNIKKDLDEHSKTADGLQLWQEAVTIYHTDDLFAQCASTILTADQCNQYDNPINHLDMTTLVEWSPEGYLSKLKDHNKRLKHQRKVHAYSIDGTNVTRALFETKEIHLLETYSVETPWNTDDWTPTQAVWVVKETLDKRQVLYIELDRSAGSNKFKRYYKLYHYAQLSKSILWKRMYKIDPKSRKEYKIQLVDLE